MRTFTPEYALRPLTLDMSHLDFRRWRTGLGLTQQEAADYLVYSIATIRAYEAAPGRNRKARKIPQLTVRFIQALAAQAELEAWCRISPDVRRWVESQRMKSHVDRRR
jgi:predicted transcriptional regulator